MKKHENKFHSCKRRNKKFEFEKDLIEHRTREHQHDAVFSCSQCGNNNGNIKLENPIQVHTDDNPYVCGQCNNTIFPSKIGFNDNSLPGQIRSYKKESSDVSSPDSGQPEDRADESKNNENLETDNMNWNSVESSQHRIDSDSNTNLEKNKPDQKFENGNIQQRSNFDEVVSKHHPSALIRRNQMFVINAIEDVRLEDLW